MGRNPRQRPARLAAKLLQIRESLGLSQNQMIRRLGFAGELIQSHISAYEQGGEKGREPPLGVLLEYARAAGTTVEVLIDDRLNLELPGRKPAPSKRGVGSKRAQARPRKTSSLKRKKGAE
jgi:transcriptional regulator with XRE-family HTH domain